MSKYTFSSVEFSHSVVSDSLRPHELQHARPPYPSPTSGVHPNSRPSSRWCHPAISSSVIPFSSCLQSLPASESFPMSQLFAWGGQSTGVSALASFLPKNTQDWTPSHAQFFCDPMDCSSRGSSIHVLKWVAVSFSRGSSWPRDQSRASCIGRQIVYYWATNEAPWVTRNLQQNSQLMGWV